MSNTDRRETIIYALRDPRDGEARYVGACHDLRGRVAAHLRGARKLKLGCDGKPFPKDEWLRELAGLGLEPQVDVLETASERIWLDYELEQEWIARLRATGSDLLNVVMAGRKKPQPRWRVTATGVWLSCDGRDHAAGV